MKIKSSEKHRAAAICAFAALVMVIGGILAAQKGSGAGILGRLPDPRGSASEFFDAYRNEEYEKLDKYIYGYGSIGFSGTAGSDYGNRMLSCVSSEFAYEFTDEPVINGNYAGLIVKVEYFDIPDSAKTLKKLFNEELLSRMKEGTGDIDLSVHDEEYYNTMVLPSLDKAIDKLMEQKEQYIRSESLELEMVYDETRWKIIPDEGIERILLGGLS